MSAEARREQLLDAALEVIVRDGYAAVSIEAIAREADVTRPVVYNVFDGLSALLSALLDRQERRALDQLLSTISVDLDLADLDGYLRRTVEDLVAMVSSDPLTWQPILLAREAMPGVVRGRVDRDRELVRGRIQTLVESALAAYGAKGAIDSGVVAHSLIAIAEYYGRMILEAPDSVDAERLACTISALVSALRG